MSVRYKAPTRGVVEQTGILQNVEIPEVHVSESGSAEALLAKYSWVVVLTQECDLQLDRLARLGLPQVEGKPPVAGDKKLRGILLCPAFLEEKVLLGTYVDGGAKTDNATRKMMQSNRHERFHLLPAEAPLIQAPLMLDFKLITSAHPEFMLSLVRDHPEKVIAVVCPPFRDRLMQRFLSYFGRIAEPGEG